MQTVRYKYRNFKPSSHRFDSMERVGHKVAYTVRTDTFLPVGRKGRINYLAKCTCGWKDPTEDYVSVKVMYRRFDSHIREVEKQGTLWPQY